MYFTGLVGPALMYTLSASIFSLLIFTSAFNYWAAIASILYTVVYGLFIYFNWLPKTNPGGISLAEWIAISSNLIFLSFLLCALLPSLFTGLQKIIQYEISLRKELNIEKQALKKAIKQLEQLLIGICEE